MINGEPLLASTPGWRLGNVDQRLAIGDGPAELLLGLKYPNATGHLVQHTGFNGDTTTFCFKGSKVFAPILTILLRVGNDIIDTKSHTKFQKIRA